MWTPLLFVALLLSSASTAVGAEQPLSPRSDYPERELVLYAAQQADAAGVVFHIYDQGPDGLANLLPRINDYIRYLRGRGLDYPIVVMTHGTEMLALSTDAHYRLREVHESAQQMLRHDDVIIQGCAAFAASEGLDETDFPDFMELVPYAPSQLSDYRTLDYLILDVTLEW